jgi:transcriptional regulator with XRE-family HTH domain
MMSAISWNHGTNGSEGKAMSIGTNIKMLREQRDLTMRDVAEVVVCSVQTIASWEQDRKVPSMETIKRLADLFGVPMGALIDGDAKTITRLCLREDEHRMLELYRRIPSEQRPHITAILEAVLKNMNMI